MKSGNGQRWSFVIPGMRRSVEHASGQVVAGRAGRARRGTVAVVVALATLTAGCADDVRSAATGDTTAPSATPSEDQTEQTQGSAAMPEDLATATSTLNVPVRPNAVLTGEGLVVQVDDDPPVLCLAPYVETYPPQCSGPLLLGLAWEEMPPYSMAQNVRWGQARVVGTFDGATFTLTQPPSPPGFSVEPDGGIGSDPLTTLCADPFATGGGSVLDPLSPESESARASAIALLEDNPDYASSFMSDESSVLNVLLVEDAEVAPVQSALREVWPGGLCVEAAEVPARDAVYQAMDTLARADLPNVFSWTASPEGGLEVVVLRADEDMIIRIYSVLATVLDQDDIHITSALTPVDPQPRN